MNIILQALFNPVRAFNELKRENKFPGMALVIFILLSAVYLILMVPITSKVTALTMSLLPMPETQLDTTMTMMHKLRYLMVIGSVFTYLIMMFIYALVFYIVTVVAKPTVSYIKAFTLIIYGYFAVLIGEFVNTGILYFRGLENITNPFEMMFTGLNVFTTINDVGAGIYMLLCLINPFQIWFVVLLSVGLKVFADIKYSKALLIWIIYWLILLIYPVASAIISEMAMNKIGLM